jgi:DNA repair protein RecO (recombination protein O)
VSRISLESAYVLHQRPYQDSGLLLEVFTLNHGRIGLVARGVRKPKGRWQSLLQPFTPLLLSWSGRGELGTVTDAEMSSAPHLLKGQLLLSSFYINELLTRLLHRHDPHPELFDYYHVLLNQLSLLGDGADARQQLQQQLRLFEKQLLQEIGYGLVLDHDVATGDAIEAAASYSYRLGEGPVLVADGASHSLMIRGRSLLALAAGRLEDVDVLRDAKRLMRAALDQQLGGRPLHSRQLLMDLQRTTTLPM